MLGHKSFQINSSYDQLFVLEFRFILGVQLCNGGAFGCDDYSCQLMCKLPWHGCDLGVCGGGRCQCSDCYSSKQGDVMKNFL